MRRGYPLECVYVRRLASSGLVLGGYIPQQKQSKLFLVFKIYYLPHSVITTTAAALYLGVKSRAFSPRFNGTFLYVWKNAPLGRCRYGLNFMH